MANIENEKQRLIARSESLELSNIVVYDKFAQGWLYHTSSLAHEWYVLGALWVSVVLLHKFDMVSRQTKIGWTSSSTTTTATDDLFHLDWIVERCHCLWVVTTDCREGYYGDNITGLITTLGFGYWFIIVSSDFMKLAHWLLLYT